MNAKEQNIQRLYKARTTHLKWVNSLKLLVSGFDIDKKTLTPLLQDSEFGKWFYNEAMQFSQFNSKNVLEELETYLAMRNMKWSNLSILKQRTKRAIPYMIMTSMYIIMDRGRTKYYWIFSLTPALKAFILGLVIISMAS